tara:strand:- start:4281 stop:5300 length:1020 start_codon:yes stop_codon:yes gene_type:complete
MDSSSLLNRLIKGCYYIKIRKKNLKIKPSTIDLENKADIYYNKIIEDLKFDDKEDWLSEKQRIYVLLMQQIWNDDKQKQLDILLSDMSKLKVQLYKNFSLIDTRKLIKEKLNMVEEEIGVLHNEKYKYFEYTKESYATSLKNNYIIRRSVYFKNRPLFKQIANDDHFYYLKRISNQITELDIKDIRGITHNESWKSLWDSAKTNVFSKPIIECNIEQRMLISASLMLDNIRQHPKCPHEDILKDSDALDGWVIHQNEEFEREQKKSTLEASIKDRNAGEVFVMAKSPEEIAEVMSLNDPLTRRMINKTVRHAKNTEGQTAWQDIPGMKETIVREQQSEQ